MAKSSIQKVEDYKCPKCKKEGDFSPERNTLVEKTRAIFTGDYEQFDHEPGGVWIEIHKCDDCGMLYCYQNGC